MPQNIVVIGAVALGPKAACRVKRLDPKARVTMVDKDSLVSYGGCGIPYFISGDVSELKELRTTSFKLVRDEKFFQECKDIDVLARTLATRIDRQRKVVALRDLNTGQTSELPYDKLVISTGASPRKLNLPGTDLAGVHCVANLHDALAIRDRISKGQAGRAVIVGSGFIGLEMAEALADMWGLEVTVVEALEHMLPRNISPQLAAMAEKHLREKGVELYCKETVVRIEGEGKVERVVTSGRTLEADLVILCAGVVPNSELAREAGLELSPRGGILVDASMRTSDPDIFSGGDCVEIRHLITGQTFNLPMGSMANRQGRVIGTNLAGGAATFEGAVGSFALKLFERSLSGAGLTPEGARLAGLDALSVLAIQFDRAHFYPGSELMTLELTVERSTRRLLGVQGFGPGGDALVGRVGAVAALLQHGGTVEDLSNLEFPYSPPYASAMDIVNTLGNLADNMLAGMNAGMSGKEFAGVFAKDSGQCFFLDCREADNAGPYLARHPGKWHNIPQGKLRERLAEVPRDKPVVIICNTGIRSYESQIILGEAGIQDVENVHGGMAALKQCGYDLLE